MSNDLFKLTHISSLYGTLVGIYIDDACRIVKISYTFIFVSRYFPRVFLPVTFIPSFLSLFSVLLSRFILCDGKALRQDPTVALQLCRPGTNTRSPGQSF
jgi:hypothetical protein